MVMKALASTRMTVGNALCIRSQIIKARRSSSNTFYASNPEYIIAPDEQLAKFAFELAFYILFSVGQLQVHVVIERYQFSSVLKTPFQPDSDIFPWRQILVGRK
eukprot:Protomagalhaensia_sp_Gyna_25__787@NODE_137_length_4950_cov_180_038078_g108_i0_p7_GENE_NODE_137_length_4950_cov_180_038078_g108_i0NODE_137_length_4950_cov_180_038078_g108_i0_p7_ORF_typecomplete_len104_score12_23_NODE_137_length_4950_cov_180_038078_g108_i0458769